MKKAQFDPEKFKKPDADKRKNIIKMCVSFSGMQRVLLSGSNKDIESKLNTAFSELEKINSAQKYNELHDEFCLWFTKEIKTTERKEHERKGKIIKAKPSVAASYGQGAKVMDVSIKAYVYYCLQPEPEISGALLPLLKAPIDNPILKHLLASEFNNKSLKVGSIFEIDKQTYNDLQMIFLEESKIHDLYPVQYEDVLWRLKNITYDKE